MCSFIMQRRVCKQCRSPIEYVPVDKQHCGKPPKRCPGKKRRGTTVRYVDAEECSICALEALVEESAEEREKEDGSKENLELDSAKDDEEAEFPPNRPMQLGLWM
ncbi:hypothetical protein C8A01DRAFT_17876 [Parachaetomium inaequale]|uniref:Uncharacterized protein n=1 Tax=Parachaetomium inaequale TaxID=2588326 RepID=A0AAN6PFG1_9PEZI|nr:hypothetical protein C8A01DRAFT_17876 [Parachaetomium inaequale]